VPAYIDSLGPPIEKAPIADYNPASTEVMTSKVLGFSINVGKAGPIPRTTT
jgi:hypothetical protein